MIIHAAVLISAFAILWFLALFCLLPIGIGEADPETGAPKRAHFARKAAYATAIATVLFAVFYGLVVFGVLDL